MIIKLTSAAKPAVPNASIKYIYINTAHLLKMGREEGPPPSEANYIYPHTVVSILNMPAIQVLETPDLISDLANSPLMVME